MHIEFISYTIATNEKVKHLHRPSDIHRVLLVTFSLMSILWLTQSLRFVELVTNKGLPLSLFIKMTSCLMPRLFALLSPISLFVAVLFVYNRMLSDRELVVMKSAGISPWQNAKPAFLSDW